MIKRVIRVILGLSICMMFSAANAAQGDLDDHQIAALQEAYKNILAKKYNTAKKAYHKIQTSDGIEPGVKRAAIEGEGLAMLLDLIDRVGEAKHDKVKTQLLRFQRRTTVGYLEKALKNQPDETLNYMLALAKEEDTVSDKTFDGLLFSDEYKRLLVAKKETPIAPDKKQKIKIIKIPETKSSNLGDAKIQGARTAIINNVKYKTEGAVNLRSGPGTNFVSIAMLTDNQDVVAIRSVRLLNGQQWLKVKVGGLIGYTSANYLTKTTSLPRNGIEAKTVNALPANTKPNTVKKPIKTSKKGINQNNKNCSGEHIALYLTMAKIPVFKTPGGPIWYSIGKNQRIKIWKIFPEYLILRTGASADTYVCGYILRDAASLKKVG